MTIRISSMAPKGLYSGSHRWVPLTVNFSLQLVRFSLLIILCLQSANSAAVVSNNNGDVVPSKPDQKFSEIHRRLQAVNKHAIKTIQSPDGDIIDCVLRYEQPAFDHPLLRNHTIQEFPKSPHGIRSSSTANRTLNHTFQIWHLSGISCPDGAIPIRRTSVEDLMRSESPRLYGKKSYGPPGRLPNSEKPAPYSGHEYAIANVQGNQYHGSRAIINVWDPRVEVPQEFSLSEMWVLAGSYANSDLNSMEVGWQVFPSMYGDNRPRLFTYWTSDSYQLTGCYNLLCPGFIQTDSSIVIGGALSSVSSYNGTQVDLNILVWKDPDQGNWWLKIGTDINVGYWPSHLFTDLADHAETIQWGGEIVNRQSDGGHTNTQMGNGHFAEEGYSRASYVRNLEIVDTSNTLQNVDSVQTLAEFPKCYDLKTFQGSDWGTYFYFGGPGRNPECP